MIFDVAAAAAAADGGGGDGSDRHLYPNHRHHRWNLNRTWSESIECRPVVLLKNGIVPVRCYYADVVPINQYNIGSERLEWENKEGKKMDSG